ncbi:MAG: hypothetical protein KC561_17050, partial [Myxococcales bacterium]|nr:hypothetical protein [Myxococcales bacterium]
MGMSVVATKQLRRTFGFLPVAFLLLQACSTGSSGGGFTDLDGDEGTGSDAQTSEDESLADLRLDEQQDLVAEQDQTSDLVSRDMAVADR